MSGGVPHHRLVVVGGGPAGLAHAFWRRQREPDLDVIVLEARPWPGGWVRTRRIEGFSCELGPQGLRPTADSDALIEALGLQDDVLPCDADAAKTRWIGRGGVLHPVPAGPGALRRSRLLGPAGKLRLLTEPLRRRGSDPEETVDGFVARRFGRQAVPLAGAMVQGVFGGDAGRIEVAAAFPRLVDWEQEHGSVIVGMMRSRHDGPRRPVLASFQGGMGDLVQALRRALEGSLRLACPVCRLQRHGAGWHLETEGEAPTPIDADEVVLALPARNAAGLVRDLDPELAAELEAIACATIANTYLGFWADAAAGALPGFGFLLDPAEDTRVLGALHVSSVFPGRAAPGRFLVRVMSGGARHPDVADADDEVLAEEAEAVLRRYTGITAPVVFRRVLKAVDAIPQYVTGHRARVDRIRTRAATHPGLSLIGNSYDEVSVSGQLGPPRG